MQRIVTHENWIGSLPGPIRDAVLARMTEMAAPAGKVIAQAGRDATYMFQVVEGYVRLSGLHEDGSEALITIYVAGNCYAETAIVARRPYNHTSTAMVASRILRLHERDFWELYYRYSAIPEALCRKFANAIARQIAARETRATTTLRTQIANMFEDFAGQCATVTPSDTVRIEFPLTQSDIASIFDVTRQSVQREVTFLKAQRLVEKRDGAWVVLDLERLKRLV